MATTVVFWFAWLVEGFRTMPEFLGNNWHGVFLTFTTVFFLERAKLTRARRFRKADRRRKFLLVVAILKARWKGTLKYWAYLLFAFFIGHTLDLVRQNATTLSRNATENAKLLQDTKDNLGDQISDWKAKCTGLESARKVLENQNRDQQNSINNCQNQAIKMLTPADLAIKTVEWDISMFGSPGTDKKTHIFVVVGLTNKAISPVDVTVFCDAPVSFIGNGSDPVQTVAPRLGQRFGTFFGATAVRIDDKSFSMHLQSPAWTPNNPIGIPLSGDGHCQIKQN